MHVEWKTLEKETFPWRGQLINETDLKRLLKSLSPPPPSLLSPFTISLYGGTWAFQKLGFAFWGLMEPPADWDIKGPGGKGRERETGAGMHGGVMRGVCGWLELQWWKIRWVRWLNKVPWPEQWHYSFVVIGILHFKCYVCYQFNMFTYILLYLSIWLFTVVFFLIFRFTQTKQSSTDLHGMI